MLAAELDVVPPYLPGTFWQVDTVPMRIDPAGRPRVVASDEPVALPWWLDGRSHTVRRLHLVPA